MVLPFPEEKLGTSAAELKVLEKPKGYMPTLYEWLENQGEEKGFYDDGQVSGTSTSDDYLYQVPKNHTFYITSVTLGIVTRGTGLGGTGQVKVALSGDYTTAPGTKEYVLLGGLIESKAGDASGESLSNCISPVIPIKVTEEQYISYHVATFASDTEYSISITGFLVKKHILPYF